MGVPRPNRFVGGHREAQGSVLGLKGRCGDHEA
jgi:hypothetical protein